MYKETSSAAAEIDQVSHSYGPRRALDRVSFAVAPGKFTVLLGLNGAGKSTLFALMTRLYGIQEGRIRLFGYDVARESGAALRILGVVFQARTLDLDLSVRQNLMYHAALHGIGDREARNRMETVLTQVVLSDRVREKVRSLSGGQMRRVEIARALMHTPSFLLLDEPTVGLDVKSRADILSHVRRLVAEDGIGVLWATHLMDEVSESDHVIVLHKGQVLADGIVVEIVAKAGARDLRETFNLLTNSYDEGLAA
jgi:ABC-2 type transport system ATP-binding protein